MKNSNLTIRTLVIILFVIWTSLQGAFAQTKTFIGTPGSNYSTSSNWSPTGTPGVANDVIIPTGKVVLINSTVNCRDITIQGTGAIDFSGSGNLNVYRDLYNSTSPQNNFAFDGLSGTVTFKGTVSNNTDGAIYDTSYIYKVIVDKYTTSNKVSLSNYANLYIRHSLYLKKGDIDARQGHAKLTLDAIDASGNWQTAYIDGSSTATGNVLGKASVSQITYDNYKTYHYICGPVVDSAQTYWTTTQLHTYYNQTIVNNTGYSYPTGTIPDFIYYDETVDAPGSGAGADAKYGWKGTNPQTSSSTRVATGQSTCSRFRPYFSSGSPLPFVWTGIPNNGNITVNLTYTNNHENGDGANHIGNPYPSPIDWKKVYDDLGYFPVIFIWYNDGTEYEGSYYVFDAEDPNNSTYYDIDNGRIPIGQGFILAIDSLSTTSLTWQNSYRSNAVDPAFYRQISNAPIANAIDIKLRGTKNKDITLIHFGDYNSTDNKPIKNISKMMNPSNSLYSIQQNKNLNSLNLSFPSHETVIPLGIKLSDSGIYFLEAANINLPIASYNSLLIDNFTGKTIELDANFKYEFESNSGTFNDRFVIKVLNNQTTSKTLIPNEYAFVSNTSLVFQLTESSNEKIIANITDANGKLVWSNSVNLQNGRGTILNNDLPNGLLILNVISGNKSTNFKLIKSN